MRHIRTAVIAFVLALAALSAQAQTTYQLLFQPGSQFFDNNGDPLAGGKICTYAAGTSTPQAVYTDSTGGTPHSNPVVLDSAGRPPSGSGDIWGGPLPYKISIDYSTGDCSNPIRTIDNVSGTTAASLNCTGCVSDSEIDATGITTRSKLPTEVAYEDQSNTWTTGAQDMSAATSHKVPVTAGAAPTASGSIHYDSTANQMEYGDNGTNRAVANLDEAQTLSNKTFSDNLVWQSGTGNSITFDQAATTTRTVTFPDLSGTAAYLDNAQTFTGAKTFSATPTFGTMTSGSVLYAGASGVLSQNNSALYWDNAATKLQVTGTVQGTTFLSGAGDPADSGAVRLGNAECVVAESNPAGTDGTVCYNSSNQWETSTALKVGGGVTQIMGGTSTYLGNPLIATVNTTAVGNVGSGEDDLMTYSLPANALSANAKGVRIKAWGTTANNANAKTVKLYFGAVMLTNSLTTGSANRWTVEGLVFRTGSNAQDSFGELRETGTGNSDIEVGTLTQSDSGTITIKCTGEATSDNDVVQEGFLVEFIQ
jgi:hypothetical protein